MIHMPRRSITRFFVPMVDVMILLFSIFLLMPVLQEGGKVGAGLMGDMSLPELIADHKRLKDETAQLQERVQQLKRYELSQAQAEELHEDIVRLQREKINTLKSRLDIRVLEIDPANGKLVYYDRRQQPPVKEEIDNPVEARQMIRRHKQEAGEHNLELYYLILFPRVDSAYPEERQFREYQRWLDDVAYGVDRPPVPPVK